MVSIHKQEELIFEKCQALLGDDGEVSADGLTIWESFTTRKVTGKENLVTRKRIGNCIALENVA